ncbi:MAG: hypothetical protein IPK76_22415 [Lewinellaceae bacterium]|nr:hypothetical protein [Lewinellaceae bacterium]
MRCLLPQIDSYQPRRQSVAGNTYGIAAHSNWISGPHILGPAAWAVSTCATAYFTGQVARKLRMFLKHDNHP